MGFGQVWDRFGGAMRRKHRVAALGASSTANNFADLMLMVSVLTTAAAGLAGSFPVAALTAAVAGLINGAFIGIGHK